MDLIQRLIVQASHGCCLPLNAACRRNFRAWNRPARAVILVALGLGRSAGVGRPVAHGINFGAAKASGYDLGESGRATISEPVLYLFRATRPVQPSP